MALCLHIWGESALLTTLKLIKNDVLIALSHENSFSIYLIQDNQKKANEHV